MPRLVAILLGIAAMAIVTLIVTLVASDEPERPTTNQPTQPTTNEPKRPTAPAGTPFAMQVQSGSGEWIDVSEAPPNVTVRFIASRTCEADACPHRWYDELSDGPGSNDVLLAPEGRNENFSCATADCSVMNGKFLFEGTKYIRLDGVETSRRQLQIAAGESGPANPEPTPTQPTTTPVWRGDPGAGRRAWDREHMANPARASVTTVGGRDAWRMEVREGELQGGEWERTEFGQDGNAARQWDDNTGTTEYYLGYSVYLPAGFPNAAGSPQYRFTCLTQWKDQDPDLGSPSFCTQVREGRLGISTHIDCTRCWVWSRPATTDVWHNIVVYMKHSRDPAVGRMQVWYSTGDSRPVSVYDDGFGGPVARQTYRHTESTGRMVPRMGYYRAAEIPVTAAAYHADWKVGRSFNAVNPV